MGIGAAFFGGFVVFGGMALGMAGVMILFVNLLLQLLGRRRLPLVAMFIIAAAVVVLILTLWLNSWRFR